MNDDTIAPYQIWNPTERNPAGLISLKRYFYPDDSLPGVQCTGISPCLQWPGALKHGCRHTNVLRAEISDNAPKGTTPGAPLIPEKEISVPFYRVTFRKWRQGSYPRCRGHPVANLRKHRL